MNLPVILRVFKGEQVVEVKQFQLDQIVIGNQAEVNLNLNDSSVSPIHALIEKRNETYYVCDLGSAQGTFKGQNQILDEVLESGEELQIGAFRIQFNVGAPRPKVLAPDAKPMSLPQSAPLSAQQSTSQPAPVATNPIIAQPIVPQPVISQPGFTQPVMAQPIAEPIVSQAAQATTQAPSSQLVTPAVEPVVSPAARPQLDNGIVYNTPVEVPQVVVQAQPPVTPTPAAHVPPPVTVPPQPSQQVQQQVVQQHPVTAQQPVPQQVVQPPSMVQTPMQSAAVVKPAVTRPNLVGTFAPVSAISENHVIKASKGSVLEVSVGWKERIIETYHFRGNKSVTVGSREKVDIPLPGGVFSGSHVIVDFQSGVASVNLASSMSGDLILERNSYNIEMLRDQKRISSSARGHNVVRLEQGEAFRVALVPGLINIYIRYVPSTQKPNLLPFLPFTTGEMVSVLLATAFVGLMAIYNIINAPVEKPKEEIEPEIISVTKFVYPTVKPPREKSVPPPPTPPPVKVETPPKEKQKLVLGDKNQAASVKNDKPAPTPSTKKASSGNAGSRAAEVAPNKNTSAKKKFTSVQQGGAVKLGAQAGANASQTQKPVDLSNVGLTSTFGGGGVSSKLKQAVQGAGGIIGDANQATGAAGFSKNRPGDDLGSAFKDTGAGGKGVATEGISGGITNGRGSGNSGYGGVGSGLGDKSGVQVDVGGYGATFAGTIDRNAVLRVIQSKKSVIRRCYEKELRFKKGLSGRLVVRFEIGDKGKVLTAKIDESSLNNTGVENCLKNELVTWQFPEPPADSIAEVLFPFNFQNEE